MTRKIDDHNDKLLIIIIPGNYYNGNEMCEIKRLKYIRGHRYNTAAIVILSKCLLTDGKFYITTFQYQRTGYSDDNLLMFLNKFFFFF